MDRWSGQVWIPTKKKKIEKKCLKLIIIIKKQQHKNQAKIYYEQIEVGKTVPNTYAEKYTSRIWMYNINFITIFNCTGLFCQKKIKIWVIFI